MADLRRTSTPSGDRSGEGAARSELEDLAPFLELAREIKRNVDRFAADDFADVEQLTDAIDAIPLAERRRVTEAVFERLPADVQWAILERVFGDEGIREHLADEHDRRVAALAIGDERRGLADAASASRSLDTRQVPPGVELTIGLFRELDVRIGMRRGHEADSCARRVVLRAEDPPRFRVIEDVFNPRGGLFVTREYDEATWEAERFESNSTVEVGAMTETADGVVFEPVLYIGGRADFRIGTGVSRGQLHIGFVMLGDIDVFAGRAGEAP
jgi:hypothetical protein